ncbi:MAG: LCP family protein [Candidatus Kerfeldbacteria bacterium]
MPIQRLQNNQQREELKPSAEKRPRTRSLYWWKIAGSLVGIVIVFIVLVGYRILAAINTTVEGNKRVSVLTQLGHIVSNRDAQLKGEADDRINILLLGIGGEGHDGPLLTDTIMLASVKPSTNQVALLSIPRDLAVEIPQYGNRKINNANAFGKELGYPGGGEQLASDVVAKTVGQTVHYYARIDFAGFKDIIDSLGGISVTVENSFTDSEYPTANYGYQTIRFVAGEQYMNGETALKFVRSRHGNNGEGSDFARSRRQQLVLEAVRDKTLSLGTIMNPIKIGNVLSSLGTHTRTNLEVWEILRLGKMVSDTTKDSIISKVLDSAPTGLLKNATGIDGAFLLLPKDDDFRAVRAYARDIFIAQRFTTEAARIVIRDESGHSGTAKMVAASLESLGFPAPTTDQTGKPNTDSVTAIIDYTNGAKPSSLKSLESYLGVSAVPSLALSAISPRPTYEVPKNVNNGTPAITQPADLLIIIGKDFVKASTSTTYNNGTSTKKTNANANTNSTNKNTNSNSNKNVNVNKNSNANKNINVNTNSALNTNS